MKTQNLTMSQDKILSGVEHDGYIDEDGDVQFVLECIIELDNRLTDVTQEKSDLENEIGDLKSEIQQLKDANSDLEIQLDQANQYIDLDG